MEDFKQSTLWLTAFAHRNDGLDGQRDAVADAYLKFRERVTLLLEAIRGELPSLTRHDITHVDALWRIASQIAGPEYPLNPAEALVLGGAFLLHDAAHCRAAFAGGIDEIRNTPEWRDAAAQRGEAAESLLPGSEAFQAVLFDTLRVLHPRQARNLPFAHWTDKPGGTTLHLFPHDELREAYGHLIGDIAASHWSHPHELEAFANYKPGAPACLAPAGWRVDALKLAILLRVADAAHIDAKRAPRLLLAMNRPQGVSCDHWRFQARLHQPYCDAARGDLVFTGSPFPADEQGAWWLAYEAACYADRELTAADRLLVDYGRPRLAAREVAGMRTPEAFSRHVPTSGWAAVDASLRIGDIKSVVEKFGGTKLYGDKPYLALRELLQNARDAVFALRALGGLDERDGSITVELEQVDGKDWLHVTDTGIGMSRYVLTHVLLDFGRSLWRDTALRSEWPGLAASKFDPVGRFGIGFFAVFMLGEHVKVTTRRYDPHPDDDGRQWVLEFAQGVQGRPILRSPRADEGLRRSGTRVSVCLTNSRALMVVHQPPWTTTHPVRIRLSLAEVVGALAPAMEVDVWTREGDGTRRKTITAGDWRTIESEQLLLRIAPCRYSEHLPSPRPVEAAAIRQMRLMKDADDNCWGRCSAKGTFALDWAWTSGVVVVGGLFGGSMNFISGVLIGVQVDCLDRSAACPAGTAAALKDWADEQARRMQGDGELDREAAERLLLLGAANGDLPIIQHRNVDLTVRAFKTLLSTHDEIHVLALSKTEFNANTDQVPKSEFENRLELNLNLFILHGSDFPFSFVPVLSWPAELFPDSARRPAEVFDQILDEEWGDYESEEVDDYEVGTVNGTPILRSVTIYRRKR